MATQKRSGIRRRSPAGSVRQTPDSRTSLFTTLTSGMRRASISYEMCPTSPCR